MADYRLPSLGADMDEAVLVEWKVNPGDTVRKGQVVALIETSKSVMDIEFFEDAVIGEILVPVGETVAVGTPIARYEPAHNGRRAPAPTAVPAGTVVAARPAPAETWAAAPGAPPAAEPAPGAQPAAEAPPAVTAGHRRVHPPARRLAEQLGVDLDRVSGTGPAGMVLRADVRAAAGPAATDGEPEDGEPAATEGAVSPTAGPPRAIDAPAAPPPSVRASPRARRLAQEHAIDLARVEATGADGTISGEDVERAAAARRAAPASVPAGSARSGESRIEAAPSATAEPKAAPSEAERAAARRLAMRRAIADLMARSKREIPHYYLQTQIDMTRALDWLEAENLVRPMTARLLPAVLLIKATALAARENPALNGFWVDDHFVASEAVHAGIAISLREGGLVAPAIHDAEKKRLEELMASLRDLVARARAGILHRAEMTDPTITITNLGDLGVELVHGVIYPPQVALVGFGRITERPWAAGGMVGSRRAVTATLAADHRATDGHTGGILLAAIDRLLQEPEKL